MRTLLGRELSFIPAQKSRNTQEELVKHLHDFENRYIDKWMMKVPNRARRILLKTTQCIKYDLRNCTHIPMIPNQSKQESNSLKIIEEER